MHRRAGNLQAAPWLPSPARALFMVSQLMLKMVMVIPGDACIDDG
jgi:hypothetical protein